MTLVSFCAYALWVLAAVHFCGVLCRPFSVATREIPRLRSIFAPGILPVLGAFAFIPPGSLPPFYNTAWGGAVFVAILAGGLWAARGRSGLLPCAVFLAVFGVFTAYARVRGMPGSAVNLGTFVAMPVWSIASFPEICGFFLLVPAFVIAARLAVPLPENGAGLSDTAFFCAAAFFVVLFLPWNLAPFVRWPSPVVAGCDYVLFWGKVFFCCYAVSRLPLPSFRIRCLAVFCAAVGVVLLLAETV